MSVETYSTNFLAVEDVFDQITPQNIINMQVVNPHGEWRPAPWLPVAFTKSAANSRSDAFVISKGKVVAFDRQGYIIPAGWRYWVDLASDGGAGTGNTMLTYTATDYAWKVIDLTTGLPYATNGTTNYTVLQVAKAIVERGLVPEDVTTNPPSNMTHCEAIFAEFFSKPVGIVPYDVFKYAGTPDRGDQSFTNYNKQQLIQFVTSAQMLVPHRVADSTSSDAFDFSSIVVVTAGSTAGDFPVAGEVWSSAALADNARFAAMGVTASSEVHALALAQDQVAAHTTRTPISADVSGVLARMKTSVAQIKREGDWMLDQETGLILVHDDTIATLQAGSTTVTFTYNYYKAPASATDFASSDRYVYFEGEVKPGDLLSCDAKSNFCVRNSASDIFKNTVTLGRALYEVVEPRGMLEKVRTLYNRAEMSNASKMPGTATAGFSDAITLASETVADRLVCLVFSSLNIA